jgi:hypothetical protein
MIAVPPETYAPFRRHAEEARRGVEEAVIAAMRAALEDGKRTAADRRAMLDALDTSALWQIVRRGSENEEILVLCALNEKRERQGLSEAEEHLVRDLIGSHDRAVLVRAKALALPRRRGEDVSAVLAPG